MNSPNDLQQAPSLPVDFESVAKKLQASRKRNEKQYSRRHQRYKKRGRVEVVRISDHINSVDVSQNIRSGEVVMANKELELKWLMAEGGEL
mmetsp:Transcript_13547/g.17187  ORF Transcript_13547/g.17187 Transcript_13547/m.17187 type:complete len:91 (+) Transcript_13547:242-514(+)